MMVRDMKLEIIGSETIKPSSPIPHNHKTLKFSLFDQLAPPSYVRLILFYSINNHDVIETTTYQHHHQIISEKLKKSLSESLTLFYPFSGRIKSNMSIELGDDHEDDIGAHYIEARIHCTLSSFLEQPDIEALKHLHPIVQPHDHDHQSSKDATSIPLLQVQVSFFERGGLAIGLSMSHKLTDAATMSKFVRVWAAIAVGHEIPLVDFEAASYFPPREHISSFQPPSMLFKGPNKSGVQRRYVFDGTKIEALREKAMSQSVHRPSRVEAVTALIWRCAMAAACKKSTTSLNNKDAGDSSKKKKSIIIQLVNIRKRVKTSFLENTMGNLVQQFAVMTDESEMELQDLVARLRKGNIEFGENIDKLLGGDKLLEMIDQYRKEKEKKSSTRDVDGEEMMKLYSCSSWCRFGLYDVADFGWGKPIWISNSGNTINNFFSLMDTKGGDGIEALVALSDEEMELFEKDPEFLAFASSNPRVLLQEN